MRVDKRVCDVPFLSSLLAVAETMSSSGVAVDVFTLQHWFKSNPNWFY